jgi:hypothetical protein
MADPKDRFHEAEERVEEKVEELVQEVEEGESARTPFLALTGVTLVIAAAASIMIVVLLVLYYALK